MMQKTGYICDIKLHKECDRIPPVKGRASVVHELIRSYGLLSHMDVLPSQPAGEEDLKSFHSSDYIDFILKINDSNDLEKHEEEEEEFGLGYDCPILERLYDFITSIAGSSLTAAKMLINGSVRRVINWYGGWHHAQRSEAEGFCYVNDVVLGIVKLNTKFERILYIDLDVHHGNGVENAFLYTKRVMTLSFHKMEPGFYPGTGDVTDIGLGSGSYYSVNVPLKDGIRDDAYCSLFESITENVLCCYCPNAVVVQCGTDCLSGDRLGTFNLTSYGLGTCIRRILSWDLPVMFLGGGGYNLTNAARCWTYLTSIIVGQEISTDIPEHQYFPLYGPSFELHILPSHRTDYNTKEYLDEITAVVHKNLECVASEK